MDYKYVNMEYLDSVSGGDHEVIKELVSIFKDQVIEIYQEMRSLLTSKDYTALGQLAHKAKSSVAIMGMTSLSEMLKTFELQARDAKETQLYESYIERFKNETQEAVREIDDIILKRQQ
jgi:HPt (histidine-containing phosphotransfer) domain-containing protein